MKLLSFSNPQSSRTTSGNKHDFSVVRKPIFLAVVGKIMIGGAVTAHYLILAVCSPVYAIN